MFSNIAWPLHGSAISTVFCVHVSIIFHTIFYVEKKRFFGS